MKLKKTHQSNLEIVTEDYEKESQEGPIKSKLEK
jgi:hypothetical protein